MNQKDYIKTLHLINELFDEPYNYAEHVLKLLAKYFGFKHTSFVPSSSVVLGINHMYAQKPRFMGFTEEMAHDYLTNYLRFDPFVRHNLPKHLYSAEMLRMEDLPEYMSKRVMFSEFMQKHGFAHHMCTYLYVRDTCLGGIGLYKKIGERPFSKAEQAIMQECGPIIAKKYHSTLAYGILSFRNTVYKGFYTDSRTGTIVLDTDLKVLDFNRAADDYCRELIDAAARTDAFECMGESFARECKGEHVELIVQYVSQRMRSGNGKEIAVDVDGGHFRLEAVTCAIPSDFFEMQPIYIINIERHDKRQNLLETRESDRYKLTLREREIVKLVVQGLSNQKIADMLHISLHTCKTHVKSIFFKVGVINRAELIFKLYVGHDETDGHLPAAPPAITGKGF